MVRRGVGVAAVAALGVGLARAATPDPETDPAGVRRGGVGIELAARVRDAGALPPDARGAAPMQGGQLLPYPTDVDEAGERRAEASDFAASQPELKGVEIIPTITEYLEDEDPYVRMMAAAAVNRIAVSPDAVASGLRIAVRQDTALTSALFETVQYEYIVGFDDIEMRVEAVGAILYLYYDAPSAAVKDLVVGRYWDETAVEVRHGLVEVICEHAYSDGAALDVLDDARVDYNAELVARAQACWEAMEP